MPINIMEVGPRDGLQNEPKKLSTELKIQFIDKLAEAGLKHIEVGSFVSPKWVPQMADSDKVYAGISKSNHAQYTTLVPNEEGLLRAEKAGVKNVAVFTAASETFSKKNTNASINESYQRIQTICEQAKKNNITVRGYISCTLGCPYEGEINTSQVVPIVEKLFELGCYEVALGDTIGVGTANKVRDLLKEISRSMALNKIAVHFHDTYAQAIANIYVSLEMGVECIDSSIAGLGGCPYAPGAGGNVATEDVIYLLNGLGIQTGIDLPKLIEVDQWICQQLNQSTRSKVALALQNSCHQTPTD